MVIAQRDHKKQRKQVNPNSKNKSIELYREHYRITLYVSRQMDKKVAIAARYQKCFYFIPSAF